MRRRRRSVYRPGADRSRVDGAPEPTRTHQRSTPFHAPEVRPPATPGPSLPILLAAALVLRLICTTSHLRRNGACSWHRFRRSEGSSSFRCGCARARAFCGKPIAAPTADARSTRRRRRDRWRGQTRNADFSIRCAHSRRVDPRAPASPLYRERTRGSRRMASDIPAAAHGFNSSGDNPPNFTNSGLSGAALRGVASRRTSIRRSARLIGRRSNWARSGNSLLPRTRCRCLCAARPARGWRCAIYVRVSWTAAHPFTCLRAIARSCTGAARRVYIAPAAVVA